VPARLWFGLNNSTIYFVVMLGSIPSIANGLVPDFDQYRRSCPGVDRCSAAARATSAGNHGCRSRCPAYTGGMQAGLGVILAIPDGGRDHSGRPTARHRLGGVPRRGQQLQNNISMVIEAIF